MSDIKFEWSHAKAHVNWRKHQVTFEEALTVFRDALSRTIPDPDHSEDEQRFVTLGLSMQRVCSQLFILILETGFA